MKAREWLILVVILLAGAALRLHALGRESLWLDEAYTWGVAANTSWRNVWGAMLAVSDVSPLSYVLIKLAAPFFGVAEFGLRITSALLGWLTIPVTYQLGRAMFEKSAGVVAASVIALSPFAVWYSQDARPYGLYLFLAALVLWGFWRAENGRGWILFVLASAALYLTHYVSALFVYAQAGYLIMQIRRQPLLFRKWAAAQMLAVLPVGGWVAAFLWQSRPLTGNSWIPPVTLLTPIQTVWNFVSGDADRWSLPMIVGLSVLGGLVVRGASRRVSAQPLLLWWLVLPLMLGWVFSIRLPVYIDRFFEPALLSAALLMAVGLMRLSGTWRVAAIGLTLLGMLAASARLSADPEFRKEDWRGAAKMIVAKGMPVALADAESLLGLSPYQSAGMRLAQARTEAELAQRLREGPFLLLLRSPHESAHSLSKSAPFDPLAEGPGYFQSWRASAPDARLEVHSFTGLALVEIWPQG